MKRRPTPPKIAAAGGYACGSGESGGTHLGRVISKCPHQANIVGKRSSKRAQNFDSRLHYFHQFLVTFPKFPKDLGLLSEHTKDVTGRLACFKF